MNPQHPHDPLWRQLLRSRVATEERHCPGCDQHTEVALSQTSLFVRCSVALIVVLCCGCITQLIIGPRHPGGAEAQGSTRIAQPTRERETLTITNNNKPRTSEGLNSQLSSTPLQVPPQHLRQQRDEVRHLSRQRPFPVWYVVLGVVGCYLLFLFFTQVAWPATRVPRRWTCLTCGHTSPAPLLGKESTPHPSEPDTIEPGSGL